MSCALALTSVAGWVPWSTLQGVHDAYFVPLATSCGKMGVLLDKLGIVDLMGRFVKDLRLVRTYENIIIIICTIQC